jgi:hypothetical protein
MSGPRDSLLEHPQQMDMSQSPRPAEMARSTRSGNGEQSQAVMRGP